MDPNQFAQALDQQGQVPAMVAEVARRKALAAVLDKATVTDAGGNAVDLDELVPDAEEAEGEAAGRGRRGRGEAEPAEVRRDEEPRRPDPPPHPEDAAPDRGRRPRGSGGWRGGRRAHPEGDREHLVGHRLALERPAHQPPQGPALGDPGLQDGREGGVEPAARHRRSR